MRKFPKLSTVKFHNIHTVAIVWNVSKNMTPIKPKGGHTKSHVCCEAREYVQ